MELVDPYTLISFVKENDAQYCWKQRCYWCYRWHVPFWMTQTQPPIACRRTRALGMILSCLHCQITWHQRERERSAGTWWNHGEPTNSNLTRTKWKIEWELYWNYRNILSLLHTEFFSPNHGSCRNCSNSDAVRGLNPCEAEKAIVCWARPNTSYGGCWGFCLFLPSSFVWQCLVPSDMDVASRAWSCHVPWIEMLCSNMFKPFQTQGTNHSDWSCKLQGHSQVAKLALDRTVFCAKKRPVKWYAIPLRSEVWNACSTYHFLPSKFSGVSPYTWNILKWSTDYFPAFKSINRAPHMPKPCVHPWKTLTEPLWTRISYRTGSDVNAHGHLPGALLVSILIRFGGMPTNFFVNYLEKRIW